MNSSSFGQFLQGGKRKRYMSYDLYIDTTLNMTDIDDLLKPDAFKAKHKFVLRVSYGNLCWECQLIGHLLTKVNYSMLSEVGKRVIRSLINDVEEQMTDGSCFARFTWSDIVLTRDGQVLFKHVKSITSSPEARKHNVEDSISVVDYFVDPRRAPVDLVHLLKLMDLHTKTELYSIHASLVPFYNRGWAFLQMYEKVNSSKITVSDRRSILLKLPYHRNWRAQVHQNLVLQETYEFVPGCYDSGPGNKTDEEEHIESAGLFLDFLRNGTSHRAQRSLITLPSHFDLIVFVLFPLLLPYLQEAIFDVLEDGSTFLQSVFKPLMSSA